MKCVWRVLSATCTGKSVAGGPLVGPVADVPWLLCCLWGTLALPSGAQGLPVQAVGLREVRGEGCMDFRGPVMG